jgi:hypothetical protein
MSSQRCSTRGGTDRAEGGERVRRVRQVRQVRQVRRVRRVRGTRWRLSSLPGKFTPRRSDAAELREPLQMAAPRRTAIEAVEVVGRRDPERSRRHDPAAPRLQPSIAQFLEPVVPESATEGEFTCGAPRSLRRPRATGRRARSAALRSMFVRTRGTSKHRPWPAALAAPDVRRRGCAAAVHDRSL